MILWFISSFTFPGPCLSSRPPLCFLTFPQWGLAFLPRCHFHQLTSGHEAGPLSVFLPPAFSGSLLDSHTRSPTSLTFPPHFRPHSFSSLSPALKLSPPPPNHLPPQPHVNWFALCVMQMLGSLNVASSVESSDSSCVFTPIRLSWLGNNIVVFVRPQSLWAVQRSSNVSHWTISKPITELPGFS